MYSKRSIKCRCIAVVVICLFLAANNLTVLGSSNSDYLKVYINEKPVIFQNPVLFSQTDIMMPFREFVELFNGSITWYEEDEIAVCNAGKYKLILQNESESGRIGSAMVSVHPTPFLKGDFLYAPLSFLCSGLNLDYTYSVEKNEVRMVQKDEVSNFYIQNEVYVSKNADGVQTATLNPAGASRNINTLSTGSTGELYYEIDLSDCPNSFSKASLVIPSGKINVRGKYLISEVIDGWEEMSFGNIDFSEKTSVELTDTYKAPETVATPDATADSDVVVSLDITECVHRVISSGKNKLRLHVDYNTWEPKATSDGSRVKAKGDSEANPHLEIISEPEKVVLPDYSNIEISYKKVDAVSSSRVRYTNGAENLKIDNGANAGHELNTIGIDSVNTSDITYTFVSPVKGKFKSANVTVYGRATVSGALSVTNPVNHKTAVQNVLASDEYSNIYLDVTDIVDLNDDNVVLKLSFVPNNEKDGIIYLYCIQSDRKPEFAIMTQATKESE